MRIDVSEIKTFRTCHRKHRLTSRNGYHLRPIQPQKALEIGTVFHEALAQLYLGANYEAVMKLVKSDMPADGVCLLNMIPKYYDQVLLADMNKWEVLEVEHKFEFPHPSIEDVTCVGAIDLIVYEPAINTIFGVEHKTCSKFREPHTIRLDEQPRVYFEALERYVQAYNSETRSPYTRAENGGIYINEVKKLLRDFQHKRTLCYYDDEDREGFLNKWTQDLLECRDFNEDDQPDPSYWGCQMCDFKPVCAAAGYRQLPPAEEIAAEYSEYEIRIQDHLEEKLDWSERLEEA